MFKNRTHAGLLLADQLRKYKNDSSIILAVPRGGVPIAYAVASELGFPVELVLAKKIGHPMNKEYAIGAASLTDYFIIPHDSVSEDYIQQELKDIRVRLKEMNKKFIGDEQQQNLEGKTVIIIDDGIATGNTMLSTVRLLRKRNPKKIIIGVPVASKVAMRNLAKEVDEVVSLLVPDEFYGVGFFYHDFAQVSDEEVISLLDKLKQFRKVLASKRSI